MFFSKRVVVLAAAALAIAVVIAGCGGSASRPIPVSGKLQSVRGSATGRIVLSQLGAQRIGLQVAPTQRQSSGASSFGATTIVPYSALVYDPSGRVYVFKRVGPLTYVEVPVNVSHISGNFAYLTRGPKAGAPVVSVGAEELYGVQTGVLAQT